MDGTPGRGGPKTTIGNDDSRSGKSNKIIPGMGKEVSGCGASAGIAAMQQSAIVEPPPGSADSAISGFSVGWQQQQWEEFEPDPCGAIGQAGRQSVRPGANISGSKSRRAAIFRIILLYLSCPTTRRDRQGSRKSIYLTPNDHKGGLRFPRFCVTGPLACYLFMNG